ncbi:OmpA family protein [Roseimarinus sediminis]|uniref:OmpA family protein n=1 Tax=Roseimarinus sediminis TaxID=1610899 RepID=UPI003D1FDFDD
MAPVHFVSGGSYLTDYSRRHVDELIAMLKAHPELNVWLFGHTDPRGSEELNAELSEARLRTIVDYIVSKGIGKERIYTMAFGESFPAALGQSSSELKRNRRVEFYLFEFK